MPLMYIHEKYIDWLTVSDTGMHKEASKARGEDRCCVGETEHVPVGRRDWNETEAISDGPPHQKQAAVQSKEQAHSGQPKRTMIHNNNRRVRWWHVAALHYFWWGRSVTRTHGTAWSLYDISQWKSSLYTIKHEDICAYKLHSDIKK